MRDAASAQKAYWPAEGAVSCWHGRASAIARLALGLRASSWYSAEAFLGEGRACGLDVVSALDIMYAAARGQSIRNSLSYFEAGRCYGARRQTVIKKCRPACLEECGASSGIHVDRWQMRWKQCVSCPLSISRRRRSSRRNRHVRGGRSVPENIS